MTVNVALNAEAGFEGGVLLGLHAGAVRPIEREAGEATVHRSSLLHGVTAMSAGARYTLIMFFDPLATARPLAGEASVETDESGAPAIRHIGAGVHGGDEDEFEDEDEDD